jgi:spermidine/putrescine ABC transporter ATP-binding subunit
MNEETVTPPAGGTIDLCGISKFYGGLKVVDDVGLSVRPGEFFSLLGPSGSGKTTTLMMIAGFAAVDRGAIDVDGVDVAALPPQKRDFGMVFQNYAIFPHLNVFENVAFPLRARHRSEAEIREKVTKALELVQLSAFANRFSRQLSGGQQQRVAIARAIVFEPRVVLMDEPLGALDKNLRYDMQVEIKEIQRRLGMTAIYVTHDQEEAMNMSDRIAILNKGRVEQVGVPTEVYERPANTFVARFLGEANLIEGSVGARTGDNATLQAGEFRFRARTADAISEGQAASLFVRPERVLIADESGGDTAWNSAPGEIRRVSFLGNIVRYLVAVGPSATMGVDVQNVGGSPLAVNQKVFVKWAVADSLLLVE